jgi:hypothetical protein
MAINPNTDFTAGQVLTAAQQNRFPRGVMALASSTTSYTLTTSVAIATGMTVTFTAVANRNYKITYYEPQASTANVVSYTVTQIRLTNAAGTAYQQGIVQTVSAAITNAAICNTFVGTFTAGSTTIVGCAVTTSTSGAPLLTRSATAPAFLLVEDIGPA